MNFYYFYFTFTKNINIKIILGKLQASFIEYAVKSTQHRKQGPIDSASKQYTAGNYKIIFRSTNHHTRILLPGYSLTGLTNNYNDCN